MLHIAYLINKGKLIGTKLNKIAEISMNLNKLDFLSDKWKNNTLVQYSDK